MSEKSEFNENQGEMCARSLFENALLLLGYADDFGLSNESELIKRMYTVVNSVYADLYFFIKKRNVSVENLPENFSQITDIMENIPLPFDLLNDCFVYGVAMWIAQGESDSDNQRYFARLYEYKRDYYTKNAEFGFIKDVLL